MTYQYPTAFSRWGQAEQEAIVRVIDSNRWTQGPEVEAFEAELAQYHGRRHAVFVNSGSSANLIAVAALFHLKNSRPLKAGDRVLVPALAWSTTYAPLVQYGLDLVIADADATWNAPWRSSTDACLVVGCSILGNPAYLGSWERLAQAYGAYFINDDCESLGARTIPNQRTTGSYGLMATESFFYSHQLSAIEGGAVLTDDDECARLCRLLRNHGNAGFLDPAAGPPLFEASYDFQLMGYNVRGLELHAAIARAQLPKLEGFRRAREQNLNNFEVWAMGLPLALQKPNGIRSPFGIAFTVASIETRARLVAALRAAGIDCRLPTGGSFTRHAYGARWRDQPTPVADDIHDRGLFLGNAPYPLDEEIQRAVKVMREVLT